MLLNCFLNSDTLASQVEIDSSERWAYHVKAGPSNDCTKSLRHSAPFCATGPHLTRKCARCWCGSPVEHFSVWLREPWRIRHGIYPSRIRFGDHAVILLLFLGLFYFFLDQRIHCCEEGWAYAPSCCCFVRGTAPLLNIGPLAMACLAMPSASWSAGVDLRPPRVRLVLPAGNSKMKSLIFCLFSMYASQSKERGSELNQR